MPERIAAFLEPGRSLDEGVERVRLAESLGYESVWVSHIAAREPLQLLGHYAHHTERIGFGTGVVPIFLRHPALMAQEAATLDEASGGRFSLGIGTSHKITVEGWYGYTLDAPVGRMREYSTVLRQIFTTGSSNFDGKHFSSHFGFMGYQARPDLKIYWAAMGPKMLEAAAELADGVVLWMCSPDHIRTTIRPILEKALAEHGRSFDGFDIVAAIPSGVTEDADGGRDMFRRAATMYWQLPFYRKEVEAAHPEALAAFDEGKPIPDEVVHVFAGVGSADAVRAKIEDYRDAGVTLPLVGPLPVPEGPDETLRAAAPQRS
jgi:F420-dependent oxidoreductase-like protein